MAEIITFVPSSIQDAKANLRDFIDLCRTKVKPFGRDIDFDDDIWDITGLAGKTQRHRIYHCFTRLGTKVHRFQGTSPIVDPEVQFREPFRSFAKAMISYLHGIRPTKAIPSRIAVFRYLDASLYEITGATCPTATTPQVLNHACTLMRETLSDTTAYDYSKKLELIHHMMGNLGLLAVPTSWRASIPSAQNRRSRIGCHFDEERSKKLPSSSALEALAEIFSSTSTDSREITVSSICALMLCAPDRISEALHLPLDCVTPDWTDPLTGEKGTGLRWFPLKGAAPMIKTIIPSMRDIAKRAVAQLRSVSEPARLVARWYESNPDKLFLPAHLECLRSKELLSMTELALVLFEGKCSRNAGWYWAQRNNVPLTRGGVGRSRYAKFHDVEAAILAMLPRGFPILDQETGMRFSEALCIVRRNEAANYHPVIQCTVMPISYTFVKNALKGNKTQKTIFETRGLAEPDGSPIIVSTHMLRHYLNTLARQGGALTEEDIAKWSGRKDIGQNKVYNHVSDKDMLAHIRKAVGDPTLAVGPLINIDKRIFISRDKFAELKIVTAHTNELGFCTHDFTMLPCQIHGDCINCNEQVCIKGDAAAEANLREMQTETRMLLEKARVAMGEGEYGANEWVKHQTMTLERVNQLVAILDDPTVPVGSVIQLSGIVPASRLAQAAEQRLVLKGAKSISQTIQSMDDVRALLTDATAS